MPHLAVTPPTSSAAAAVPAALPAGAGRVSFRRSWTIPRPVSLRLRLRLRTQGVRREGGGGVRTEEPEQEQETTPRTFYDLLEISAAGSPDEVRAAYRRLALKYHPDVSPPGAAAENTRRFIEVQEAYETLSDPSRRASYDRALARGVCRLAFSGARSQRAYYHHQDHEEKSGWRRSWEDQIAELKRRSTVKDSEENLSWGARMRRRRAEASSAE
ncbi:Chaperone protein dnaJ 20, chloroplastic [Dichanthelium oligosanthes]|uniref:Chaperone protein dnaJ 20, chloroplastic n=1 Tax=Dichanthelium oligosanthes TaxID=888268 RepID=A0A1E5VRB4_9POAL|nr:Chaperone protein dnaJ 20, chloroplastic [Dichanthelium oligosanthes]